MCSLPCFRSMLTTEVWESTTEAAAALQMSRGRCSFGYHHKSHLSRKCIFHFVTCRIWIAVFIFICPLTFVPSLSRWKSSLGEKEASSQLSIPQQKEFNDWVHLWCSWAQHQHEIPQLAAKGWRWPELFQFILWLLLFQDLPRFLLFGFGFYPVCYTFNLWSIVWGHPRSFFLP